MHSSKFFLASGIMSLVLMGAGCSFWPGSGTKTSGPVVSLPPAALLPGAPGGEAVGPQPEPVVRNTEVKIADSKFQPQTITVRVGSTVTWVNNDKVPHTVTAYNGLFHSGNMAPNGGVYKHLFRLPGTSTYYCAIHPTMSGTVLVTE